MVSIPLHCRTYPDVDVCCPSPSIGSDTSNKVPEDRVYERYFSRGYALDPPVRGSQSEVHQSEVNNFRVDESKKEREDKRPRLIKGEGP